MASSAGLNGLAHSVTFGVNLAVFTNLAQFIYTETKLRRINIPQSHFQKWGPFYCILIATVGVMADLSRHLVNDANNWFLLNPLNNQTMKFDFAECIYAVPSVSGSSRCAARDSGPFIIREENALGVEMSMYNDDGSLSLYGWLFTILGTWSGFAFLFIGVLWYSNLVPKLRVQFAALRNQEASQAFIPPSESPRRV